MSMCLDPLSPSHLCGTYRGFMSSQRKTERDPEVYPASLISPSWHWGAVGRPRVGRLVEDNRREERRGPQSSFSPSQPPFIPSNPSISTPGLTFNNRGTIDFVNEKLIWRGSDSKGRHQADSYCEASRDGKGSGKGMASSLLSGQLLEQRSSPFIILYNFTCRLQSMLSARLTHFGNYFCPTDRVS